MVLSARRGTWRRCPIWRPTLIGVGEIIVDGMRKPAWEALAHAGLTGLSLGPRKGWPCSTAPNFRPPRARRPVRWRGRRRSRRPLVTGALSTDAAKGSDAPFDPRIHALRPHRGQRETADHAARAAGRIGHPRLAPDRRQADPGPLLPALPAAGDGRGAGRAAPGGGHAGDRGQQRLRQSADLPGDRRGFVGREFPCRAGCLRRRHDRHGAVRDRGHWPSGGWRCWSMPRCRTCRPS